jgi:hypothetical protein
MLRTFNGNLTRKGSVEAFDWIWPGAGLAAKKSRFSLHQSILSCIRLARATEQAAQNAPPTQEKKACR